MHSEAALKKFRFKEQFIEGFVKKCNAAPDCVYSRLRVAYDYTKHEEIDAILLTSQKVILLELVTLTGKYKPDKNTWVKEEVVEDEKLGSQTVTVKNGTSGTVTEGGVVSKVTIVSTSVPNPVAEAIRKVSALKQFLESKMGPRNASDFDYRVIIATEQCTIEENKEKVNSKIIPHKNIDDFANSLKSGWTWWFLEKVIPSWPVWISNYNDIKKTLRDLPALDILVLKSGSKLYGELRKFPGVPYDAQSTSELIFKEGSSGWFGGGISINVQGIQRATGQKMFKSPCQLEPSSQLEFLCIEADSSTSVKVGDIAKIKISLRDS